MKRFWLISDSVEEKCVGIKSPCFFSSYIPVFFLSVPILMINIFLLFFPFQNSARFIRAALPSISSQTRLTIESILNQEKS